MEFIKREQGKKSEIFKGSKTLLTCPPPLPQPPWEAFSYVVKRNKKTVLPYEQGK